MTFLIARTLAECVFIGPDEFKDEMAGKMIGAWRHGWRYQPFQMFCVSLAVFMLLAIAVYFVAENITGFVLWFITRLLPAPT